MSKKYILPLLAVAGVVVAVWAVIVARQTPPPSEAVVSPPTVPRGLRAIAGAGLIEAKRENIPIGTQVAGVVTNVSVKRGDMVKTGNPLFRIDDRELKAQLDVAEANLTAANAQFERVKAAPLQGDIPPSEAAVEEARAQYDASELAYRPSKTILS